MVESGRAGEGTRVDYCNMTLDNAIQLAVLLHPVEMSARFKPALPAGIR